MGVTYTTRINKFPEMEASLQNIKGKKINVGVKGEQAWLAAIHEYGCRITITPKMRAWLHRNGLHVKDSTTQIVIPERSFLRTGFDENHERVVNKAEQVLNLVIGGQMSETQFFELIGTLLRDSIKDYAVQLSDPPKHPFSLKMNPGKENPLIVSGDMVNSIEFEVE